MQPEAPAIVAPIALVIVFPVIWLAFFYGAALA